MSLIAPMIAEGDGDLDCFERDRDGDFEKVRIADDSVFLDLVEAPCRLGPRRWTAAAPSAPLEARDTWDWELTTERPVIAFLLLP